MEETPSKKIKLSENEDVKKPKGESSAEPITIGTTDDLYNQKQPSEPDVGIESYISAHEGFNGIIKQRISDFMVNEIDLDGKVIELTNTSDLSCDTQVPGAVSLDGVLNDSQHNELLNLEKSRSDEESVLIEAGSDKERRGKIHQYIREKFVHLQSSTIDKDNEKFVKVKFGQSADKRDSKKAWPKNRGNYCKFVMHKINKDTMEAVNFLAKLLRMKTNSFTYSGTKDKRAKTSQEVTVYRYVDNQLKLGDLSGNQFKIILRNINGSDQQIEQALESLKSIGFINYYGMQRFGTTTVANHTIGRAILDSNWEEAVELILKPRPSNPDWLAEARKVWWETRDAEKALDELGGRQCPEKQLLLGLKRYEKNDIVSALNMIPRNTRLMYIHSYQSYVWNKIVSKRLKELGTTVSVGDLVSRRSDISIQNKEEIDGSTDRPSRKQIIPQVVTEENIGDYSLNDVVLPLPGFDIIYPKNDVGDWYDEILKEGGLSKNSFKHNVRDYSLAGNYRHIVIRPEDLSYEVIPYNDFTLPLILSDYEKLIGEELPALHKGGELRALKLVFSLPSSSYATMAIREVLKMDTSAAFQSTLNIS